MRSFSGLLPALALALPFAARAQEMGLDLTDTTDYRPSLAIIGIAPTDPAVSPEMGEKLKVDKVAAKLVETAQKADLFSAVTAPADAFGKLSDNYGDALKCSELDCMQKLA